ncbi:dentin sialophosphoprotein-like [Tribolium madens]|uniref:dentin sialophosphoprotein-like n=1 Tax=Tribolium madens TaxID=41895 RepID=UPI001CF752FA|nr:dentin sialophosphoprotein-like [Tribolium madens]
MHKSVFVLSLLLCLVKAIPARDRFDYLFSHNPDKEPSNDEVFTFAGEQKQVPSFNKFNYFSLDNHDKEESNPVFNFKKQNLIKKQKEEIVTPVSTHPPFRWEKFIQGFGKALNCSNSNNQSPETNKPAEQHLENENSTNLSNTLSKELTDELPNSSDETTETLKTTTEKDASIEFTTDNLINVSEIKEKEEEETESSEADQTNSSNNLSKNVSSNDLADPSLNKLDVPVSTTTMAIENSTDNLKSKEEETKTSEADPNNLSQESGDVSDQLSNKLDEKTETLKTSTDNSINMSDIEEEETESPAADHIKSSNNSSEDLLSNILPNSSIFIPVYTTTPITDSTDYLKSKEKTESSDVNLNNSNHESDDVSDQLSIKSDETTKILKMTTDNSINVSEIEEKDTESPIADPTNLSNNLNKESPDNLTDLSLNTYDESIETVDTPTDDSTDNLKNKEEKTESPEADLANLSNSLQETLDNVHDTSSDTSNEDTNTLETSSNIPESKEKETESLEANPTESFDIISTENLYDIFTETTEIPTNDSADNLRNKEEETKSLEADLNNSSHEESSENVDNLSSDQDSSISKMSTDKNIVTTEAIAPEESTDFIKKDAHISETTMNSNDFINVPESVEEETLSSNEQSDNNNSFEITPSTTEIVTSSSTELDEDNLMSKEISETTSSSDVSETPEKERKSDESLQSLETSNSDEDLSKPTEESLALVTDYFPNENVSTEITNIYNLHDSEINYSNSNKIVLSSKNIWKEIYGKEPSNISIMISSIDEDTMKASHVTIDFDGNSPRVILVKEVGEIRKPCLCPFSDKN